MPQNEDMNKFLIMQSYKDFVCLAFDYVFLKKFQKVVSYFDFFKALNKKKNPAKINGILNI